VIAALTLLCAGCLAQATPAAHSEYLMTASNSERGHTIRYQAKATGEMLHDSGGHPFELFAWSDLIVDGRPIDLPQTARDFKEPLSLDPAFKAPFPDLSKVSLNLIGPITDLMTFYVDARLAMGMKLTKDSPHAYFKFGRPSSWADGQHVILGKDSIDFDVTLKSLDDQSVTIEVRHVPPKDSPLDLPADWMKDPVGDTANNWVEVVKNADGKYRAGVGKEIFDVQLVISLSSGRIVSATQDNTVDVVERICSDDKLSDPGPPNRYQVVRHIEIH
jgi:hypothetical protein